MSGGIDPGQHVWWLMSRSFGIVAMVLVSLSVGLGLALSGRLLRGPGVPSRVRTMHEALAVSGLLAIALHGLLLLGDSYLHPGIVGITVPFAVSRRPLWTGLGVVAGWLAAIVTLSFYVRRLIGVSAWRRLHRLTFVVYGLGIVHTLGSGTDARTAWLLAILAITALPIAVAAAARRLEALGVGDGEAVRGAHLTGPARPGARPRARVEAQPGDHHVHMAGIGVERDPAAPPGRAPMGEVARDERAVQQPAAVQRVGHRA